MKIPAIILCGLILLVFATGCTPQPIPTGPQPAASAPQPAPTTENYKYRQEGGAGGSGY